MSDRELTDEAQAEREDFEGVYDNGEGCNCHVCPPCGWCTHPGNPHNQEGDEFYKPVEKSVDVMQAVRDFCKG